MGALAYFLAKSREGICVYITAGKCWFEGTRNNPSHLLLGLLSSSHAVCSTREQASSCRSPVLSASLCNCPRRRRKSDRSGFIRISAAKFHNLALIRSDVLA